MIQVPGALLARFEAYLAAKYISDTICSHLKKWRHFPVVNISPINRSSIFGNTLTRCRTQNEI